MDQQFIYIFVLYNCIVFVYDMIKSLNNIKKNLVLFEDENYLSI